MNKNQILKIAKVKNIDEFYRKFPTEEAFMAKHGGAFKKAKMGSAMVKKQLTQLTDFSNPPQAQAGDWIQRAANANLNFWEKCRLASSADNGGGGGPLSGGGYNASKYKNPYEEVSDINAYEKDERKAFKSTLPAGVELSDWVAMNRDASRMNALLRNPDYDKYTDSTGTLKPEYQNVATQFDPYYLYYKPAFAGKKSITPEDVLKLHQSQPDGLSNYKDLVNRRYMPKQEYGGYTKAEMGSYMGGETTGYQNIDFGKTFGNIDSSIGVRSQMEEMQDKLDYLKQQDQGPIASASQQGGGNNDMMQKAGQAIKMAAMLKGVPVGKRGVKVPKYQFSGTGLPSGQPPSYMQFGPQLTTLNPMTGDVTSNATGNVTQGQTQMLDYQFAQQQQQQGVQQPQQKQSPSLATTAGGRLLDKGLKAMGPLGKPISQVVNAGRQIKQSIDQAAQARQAGNLSKLALQASSMRPEETRRRYNRPEDAMFDPNQRSPSYGTGYDVMQATAEYGAMIGGNPTEIQNMYNPGDMYMDLGYEPLSDSDIVKQYRRGGYVPKAMAGVPFMAVANKVGDAAQMVGGVASGIIDMGTERRMKQNQQILGQTAFQSATQGMQNQNAAFMEDGGWVSHDWQPQVITQFGGYNLKDLLKDDPTMDTLRAGGHLKNYTAPSEQAMSTERPDFAMGGQLKTTWGGYAEPISYNPYLPGSGETVMFRGKSHEESDGNGHTGIGVKYGSGGHDSYTDYAEYGTEQADADVEVERGEPATELMDRATGETSMIVYGDMKIPSYGVSELKDPKAKGKKFKNYANDLSKIEKRQSSILEKAINRLDSLNPTTAFEKLEFESLSKVVEGANMQLKGLAAQKELLAGIQNAILDTSKEYGLKSAELAKGKIKQDKDSEMAKFGGKMETAQGGFRLYGDTVEQSTFGPGRGYQAPLPPATASKGVPGKRSAVEVKDISQVTDDDLREMYTKAEKYKGKGASKAVSDFQRAFHAKYPEIATQILSEYDVTNLGKSRGLPKSNLESNVDQYFGPRTERYMAALNNKRMPEKPIRIERGLPDMGIPTKLPVKETQVPPAGEPRPDWRDAWRQLQPYLLPSNQEDFDYRQIAPELASIAMNPLEAVQAQTFRPLLETPYTVSYQDVLNANQADYNALQRQVGYNPAALSQLSSQKYAANAAVKAQEFRENQGLAMGAYNRNRGILNDASLKNLAILDQQFQRQSQAKSNTKAQAHAALSSIADKIAKHKLENRTLGVYENMYNYRFGPRGRAINVNAPYDFNMQGSQASGGGMPTLPEGYEYSTEIRKKKTKDDAKNGSLVKAIKNL
jgi:hypothetical protein